jgi:redox-sensitive bicupin YhaK (pirin superfamily)
MTAGRGILHEEMPEPREGRLDGFQLWVNLPALLKLCPPRYQEITPDRIPTASIAGGVVVRVVAGRFGELVGPVTEIAAAPTFLDVALPAGGRFEQAIPDGHAVFAYLFRGEASFGLDGTEVTPPRLIVFDEAGVVRVEAGPGSARFLLCAGQPFREPVVRHGPFVMNTRAEIEQTLRELAEGSFGR